MPLSTRSRRDLNQHPEDVVVETGKHAVAKVKVRRSQSESTERAKKIGYHIDMGFHGATYEPAHPDTSRFRELFGQIKVRSKPQNRISIFIFPEAEPLTLGFLPPPSSPSAYCALVYISFCRRIHDRWRCSRSRVIDRKGFGRRIKSALGREDDMGPI
jgi:hypothetical protein